MTAIANGVDYKSAPEDYAALHQIYFPYIVNLVSKNGIDDNNKEDVASDILLRLMENRFLEDFDPTRVNEYQGQLRPARFKSFLSRIIHLYVQGHRDKQKRLARREIQVCDIVVGDDGGSKHGLTPGSAGDTWADLYGTPHADHADEVIDVLQEEQEAEGVRQWLATRDKRSIHDRCELVTLYNAVRIQVLAHGVYNVRELQGQFGISTTTMHNWLWWLKVNLAVLYGRPIPRKRPRVLPPKVTP